MANSKRGLASADEKTRKEVARKGGMASHGGGRKSKSDRS
jgi:general stress protein YciG